MRSAVLIATASLALFVATPASANSIGVTFVNEAGDRTDVPAGTGLKARIQFEPQSNAHAIYFTLPPDMTFLALTRDQVGRRISIYVGCKLVSKPVVRTPITGREGVITGKFSIAEARAIADDINTGVPPCTLQRS